MKRKFSKILGVGLTLALLASFLVMAAPVSALTQPSVIVAPATISAVNADYAIRFKLDKQLTGANSTAVAGGTYNLVESGDSFVVTATAAGSATITETAGTVTVALSGGATLTSYTGGVHTIAFAASGDKATATFLTADSTTSLCGGNLAVTNATAAVTVRADDTITIVFESDTAVTETPTATMVAGPGWINGVWKDATIGTITVAGTVATRTVVLTLATTTRIGEGAEVRISITDGITNPNAAGDYNLTVATSKETTAVPSADYAITVPDIGVLPGIVQQYNAADILMATATGDDAINTMVDSAGVDYTIVVGPGEYVIADAIVLDQAGLTLKSSAGADDTIIDASALIGGAVLDGSGIVVDAADVTVDGFTVADAGACGIYCWDDADNAIIQNNIVTFDEYYGGGIDISTGATGVTVSGNVIGDWGTMLVHGTDATLSGNTFGECVNISEPLSGLTITDNIMIGSAAEAIDFWAPGPFTDVLIESNTISEAALNAIVIRGTITNLQILDNDITANEGVGILIASGVTTTAPTAIAIKFNTITGNDADNDGYGIQNDDNDATVDATLNWWGTTVAADIAAMVNDTVTAGSVTIYEPFLADTADAVFSASDVAVGEASLDAKTTVGVKVEGATDATVISVAKYIANPQAAIADALAFYDVYVAGATVDPTIKFYAGDANSKLYVWSADTEAWADLSEDDSFGFSVYGGYIYIDYDAELLDETPFAVVGGAVAEPGIPKILAPEVGDDTVSLTPIFAWETVAGADGYYFQLADNANFVTPMVKLDGDLGRLVVTAYAYVGEFPYSTAYYWRVQAVSGTVAAGNLAASAWSTGVFITMAEPVEPTPPVEGPPVVIEPIVEVIVPATTEITPAWIYVIIGVGGVLVIALLVLIVRTRRVA